MNTWQTGLCSVSFRARTPEEIVAAAAEAGIQAIEWAGDAHVPPGDIDKARNVRKITEDGGLVVSSYGSYIAPPSDGLDEFDLALTTAVALGADHMRIWPGTRGKDSVDYAAEEALRVAHMIAGMGRMAAEEGVTIGLEFHPQSLTDNTESARRLIDAVGEANVYLYWQPRPGIAEADALEQIAVVGDAISHLHVFAWDEARARYPLVTQEAAWERYRKAVPEGRWKKPRYGMLEFIAGDTFEQLREDAAVLRRILI